MAVSTISKPRDQASLRHKCSEAIDLSLDGAASRCRAFRQNTCNPLCTLYSDFLGYGGETSIFSSKPMHRCVRYRSCADALILLLSCVLLQNVLGMRAFATCGDWLAHPHQAPSSVERNTSDAHMLADEDGSVDGFLASNEQPSPLPCDGPFCRNMPTKPVPTAPPSTVNPSDKLLLAACQFTCELLSRWSFSSSDNSAHALRGFPADIEHPPRA